MNRTSARTGSSSFPPLSLFHLECLASAPSLSTNQPAQPRVLLFIPIDSSGLVVKTTQLPDLVKLTAQFNRDDRKTTNTSVLSVVLVEVLPNMHPLAQQCVPAARACSPGAFFFFFFPILVNINMDVVITSQG